MNLGFWIGLGLGVAATNGAWVALNWRIDRKTEKERVKAEWRRQVLSHHFEDEDVEIDAALAGGCKECGGEPR